MTPILGSMLGIVLTDFANTFVSSILVLLGVVCAIAMGFIFSFFVDEESISPENNSQVSSRIAPKLLDLVAALATGAVASVAMVRNDIAASLPGVSIAISLVPPLVVVGVSLRRQDYDAAVGSSLLFLTNYICILVVGIMVMFLYRVHRMARRRKYSITRFFSWVYQKLAILFLLALLLVVAFMLFYSTSKHNKALEIEECLRNAHYPFKRDRVGNGSENATSGVWVVSFADANQRVWTSDDWHAVVTFTGEPPFPEVGDMTRIARDCDVNHIDLQFVPRYRFTNLLIAPLT